MFLPSDLLSCGCDSCLRLCVLLCCRVSPPAIVPAVVAGKRKALDASLQPNATAVPISEKENHDGGRQTPTFSQSHQAHASRSYEGAGTHRFESSPCAHRACLCCVPVPLSFSAEPPTQKQKIAVHVDAAVSKATRLSEAESAAEEAATQRKARIAVTATVAAAATPAAAAAAASSTAPTTTVALSQDVSKWSQAAQSYRDTISALHSSVRGEIDRSASTESLLQAALADAQTWKSRAEEGVNNAKQMSIMQACLMAERDVAAAAASASFSSSAAPSSAVTDLPPWYTQLDSFTSPATSLSSFASSSSSSSSSAAAAAASAPAATAAAAAPLSFPALPLELMIGAESSAPSSESDTRQWSELSHAFRVEIAALESYITAGRNFNDTQQASLAAAQAEAALWQERAMEVASRNTQMNIMYACIQVEVEQNAAAAATKTKKQ